MHIKKRVVKTYKRVNNNLGVIFVKKTKFFPIYIVIIALILMLIPSWALAGEFDFDNAITMGEEINILIRPSDDSGVVKTLERGTRVGLFCEEKSGWYRMIYGNYRGYMKAENLLIPEVNSVFGNALDRAFLESNRLS